MRLISACKDQMRVEQNCLRFADSIPKCLLFNKNVNIMIKFQSKFIPEDLIYNNVKLVQVMAWCGICPYLCQRGPSHMTPYGFTRPPQDNKIKFHKSSFACHVKKICMLRANEI